MSRPRVYRGRHRLPWHKVHFLRGAEASLARHEERFYCPNCSPAMYRGRHVGNPFAERVREYYAAGLMDTTKMRLHLGAVTGV